MDETRRAMTEVAVPEVRMSVGYGFVGTKATKIAGTPGIWETY